MLEIRPSCEHCGKKLSIDSEDAMICSFECTFCKDCVDNILHNVCPNCGGGFVARPIRPKEMLSKYPPSKTIVHKKLDEEAFKLLLKKYKNISPNKR